MADSQDTTTPAQGKSPAFQFYANDFIAGTRHLTAEEVGVYMRLLCWQWDKGIVPVESKRIANIAGVSIGRMRSIWPQLSEFFQPQEGGFINERLERERAKQAEYRQRQSEAGKKRWNSQGIATAKPTHKPEAQPEPSQNDALQSSVFGLRSSDFSQEQKQSRVREFPKSWEPFESPPRPEDPNDPDIRAGAFVVRYKELYLRLRRARYVGKNENFDFLEAKQLVAVFDDKTLDKLAYVWLKTDHQFAENGTRTIAKFRSMATWCQERLIEWEDKHGRQLVVNQ